MSNGIQLPYHRLRNNADDVDVSALRDGYLTIYAKDGVLYFVVDTDGTPVVILDALNSADVADLAGLLIDILLTTDKKIQFRDSGLYINSGADGKLTISSDGVGADDITIDGTVTLTDNVTTPTNKKFIFRSTGIYINSGAAGKLSIVADGAGTDDITLDGTVTLTDDLITPTDKKIGFRDSAIYLQSSADGQLDIVADGEAKVTSPIFEAATGLNGQSLKIQQATTTKTGMSGATVTCTNLIPAGSIVLGVTVRVTTLIETATSFKVGDGSDDDRWGTGIAVAANTTTTVADQTITSVPIYPAQTNVVLTATGGNFSAGATRITVHYISLVAPTS